MNKRGQSQNPTAPPNRMRHFRVERGISQIALSAWLKMSHTKLWKIENGYQEGTAEERRDIAKWLGKRPSDVFPASGAR